MRLLRFIILALCLITQASAQGYNWRGVLDALRQVETGGQPNEGRGAVGDGGRALGPLQIHRVYHVDAAERDPALGDYRRCLSSLRYSEAVVLAYMKRYARGASTRLTAGKGTLADLQKVARTHNGGPKGSKKSATLAYWKKFSRVVKRQDKRN